MALTHAAELEQSGYVIDLCPSDDPVTPITMPSTDQLLARSVAEGFSRQVGGSGIEGVATTRGVGSSHLDLDLVGEIMKDRRKMEMIGNLNKLERIEKMYKAQEILAEGIANYERARSVGSFEPEILFQGPPAMTESDFVKLAALKKLGALERNIMMERALASESAELVYPGTTLNQVGIN